MAHAGSLSAAAATGELGQIHGHMAAGGFIDERDTHLNTPLHHACLVRCLFVLSGACSLPTSAGATPKRLTFVVHPVQAGNRAAVELLLSYGADVNAANKQGKSCLQFGARRLAPLGPLVENFRISHATLRS